MKHLLLALLCTIGLITACEDPAPSIDQNQLVGLWELSEGSIDGTPANDLLQGTSLEFSPTQLSSQLLPLLATDFSTKEPYTIDGESIIINDKVTMLVKTLDAENLAVELTTAMPNDAKKLDLSFKLIGGVRLAPPES